MRNGGGEGDTQRGTKWIGKMGSEIIVMKLARLSLSAFMGILPKGSRAFARCTDCYWLIDVDRFFSFPSIFSRFALAMFARTNGRSRAILRD